MAYCSQHGGDGDSSSCLLCVSKEHHNAEMELSAYATAEHIKAIRSAEYKRANPGDFECPHCRYITLKRDASRCPLCHGTIERSYWEDVTAREKAEVKAAEERAAQLAQDKAREQEELAHADGVVSRNASQTNVDRLSDHIGRLFDGVWLGNWLIGNRILVYSFALVAAGLLFAYSPLNPTWSPSWWKPALFVTLGALFVIRGYYVEAQHDTYLPAKIGLMLGAISLALALIVLLL